LAPGLWIHLTLNHHCQLNKVGGAHPATVCAMDRLHD
jgi:hypothetical protein